MAKLPENYEVIMKIGFACTNGTEIVASAKKVGDIVRCRDCKHRGFIEKDSRGVEWVEYPEGSHCPYQCYDDDYYNRLSEDDFFCAYGERKE